MVSTLLGWPSPSTSPEAMERINPIDSVNAIEASMKGTQPREKKARRRPQQNRSPRSTQSGNSLQFCTVSHPDDFRNPTLLRENRKHVMRDWLNKERLKPSSTDIRARSPKSRGLKRPRVGPYSAPKKSTPSARRNPDSSASSVITDITNDSTAEPSVPHIDPPSPANTAVDDDRQLIPGISGRHRDAAYHGISLDKLNFLNDRLGSAINVFDVWPNFHNHRLDIGRLKLNCNRYLGSKKLGELWVPHLLKGRHAFVSTVCISTAHDDIMTRAVRQPYTRYSSEWYDRMSVRHEVLGMINDSLRDPQQAASDATIIAVLHVLTAEVMGCDDSVTRMHIDGLHSMLRARGGLAAFGDNTAMTLALTTTMYMIAVLRETVPHRDFIFWAHRQEFKVPQDCTRALPESPIFHRKPGFVSVLDVLPPGSPILALLYDLRALTDAFHACRDVSAAESPATRFAAVANLSERIFSYRHHKHYDFRRSTERYRYESLRLTSRIYAYALSNRVPLSRAAQLIISSTNATGESNLSMIPLPVQIKHSLMKSDLSDGWGSLSGVLLWLAMVVGSAANPDKNEYYFAMRETADEEARKYISAIAMRVSILLTFEHGSALVETLKSMSAIQQALAEIDEEPSVSPMRKAIAGNDHSATFANYANEFNSL